MLQTSLLLMKCLNKTETPIFLSVVCSLFPKAIFLTFISSEIGDFCLLFHKRSISDLLSSSHAKGGDGLCMLALL